MFSTLIDCGCLLKKYMDKASAKGETLEIREVLAQYTTNVIASVAFGIDIDSVANPETDFRRFGRRVFEPTFKNGLRFMVSVLFVHDSLKKLSITEMAAQSFIFWLAGFETSSTTMGFFLYEMARNEDIQNQVRKEIDDTIAAHKREVTFEAINDMKLLEMCIDETLRMYPPVFNLIRECTKDWKMPNSDLIVKKGVSLMIPAFAIQRDPKYYENPDQFQPERFNSENSAGKTFIERPYMPFGEGPRICIGLRLGKMQVKVGLVLLLQNYKFNLSGNTLKPIKISAKNVLFTPVDGLELKVTKR